MIWLLLAVWAVFFFAEYITTLEHECGNCWQRLVIVSVVSLFHAAFWVGAFTILIFSLIGLHTFLEAA